MRPRKRHERQTRLSDIEIEASLKEFAPLCARCERTMRRALPREDPNMLREEMTYQFLLLLQAYDATQGVPLAGYLARKLPWRIANWLRDERQRQSHERVFGSEDDGRNIGLEDEWPDNIGAADDAAHLDALRLYELLPQLPPKQQQVISLLLRGFTEREIAPRLGVSQPRVQQIKKAAFALLRKNGG